MGTRKNKRNPGSKRSLKSPGFGTSLRVIFLLLFLSINIGVFSVETLNLKYYGAENKFSQLFYSLYKFADIKIPGDSTVDTLEANYSDGKYIIKYKNSEIYVSDNDIDKGLKDLLNTSQRSVFLITDKFKIKGIDESLRSSDFVLWNKEVNISLFSEEYDIFFDYSFMPPIGEKIIKIPSKLIDLTIIGDNSTIKINGKEIRIPVTLKIPPGKIRISDSKNEFETDLSNFSGSGYELNTRKLSKYKTIETRVIKAIMLENGIFFHGKPNSVWISNDGTYEIKQTEFYSNYGDVTPVKEKFGIFGDIIFAYETNGTLYLITNAGEVFTMGKKTINTDMGRAPAYIKREANYLEIRTFNNKKWIINSERGLYFSGDTNDIKIEFPELILEKNYLTDKYYIEIVDKALIIYNH